MNVFSLSRLRWLLGACLLFATAGCGDDDGGPEQDQMYTLSGTASGAQEVPAVTTNATANLTGSYNETSNQLTYSITWTGLSGDATMAHFHGPAMAGQVAPPLITLNIVTNGTNGTAAGTVNIVDSVEQFFKEGKMYYNIHTTANQPGEIRSQVTLQR